MADKNLQQDLFEGQYSEKKARKTPLLGDISGQRYLPQIRIPTEYAVVAAIGVLVLMIVAYAAGVEAGKRAGDLKEPAGKITALEPEDIEAIEAGTDKKRYENAVRSGEEDFERADDPSLPDRAQRDLSVSAEDVPEAVVPEGSEETVVERLPEQEPDSLFIIQIAAVRQKLSAEEAADELKDKGIAARVKKDGNWYRIYASGYDTIEQAKKAREEIAAEYRDCYIKKLR